MCPGLLFCVFMWPVTYDFWLLLVLLKCPTVILIWLLEATAKTPFRPKWNFFPLQKLFYSVSVFLRKCIFIIDTALARPLYEDWCSLPTNSGYLETFHRTSRKGRMILKGSRHVSFVVVEWHPKTGSGESLANTARDNELTPSSDMSFYYFGVMLPFLLRLYKYFLCLFIRYVATWRDQSWQVTCD